MPAPALWLAAQAGPAGRVVATDLDPRFLAGAAAAGIRSVATTSWPTRSNPAAMTWSTAAPCSVICVIRPGLSAA